MPDAWISSCSFEKSMKTRSITRAASFRAAIAGACPVSGVVPTSQVAAPLPRVAGTRTWYGSAPSSFAACMNAPACPESSSGASELRMATASPSWTPQSFSSSRQTLTKS